MSDRHPDPQTLLRYLWGTLAAEDDLRIEVHLVTCSSCRARVGDLACADSEPESGAAGEVDYGPAFLRAAEHLGEKVERLLSEQEEAAAGFVELLAEPPARRRERIRTEPRFHRAKLCERLEEASREAWLDDPAEAVELCELAVEIADHLDSGLYSEPFVADARARAGAYLGNACRVASDLPRAEALLEQALTLQRRYSGELLTEAEILDFLASLRNTQGRFDEALPLLDRAVELYREAGDQHLEGRALLSQGMVLGDAGRLGESIRRIGQAVSRIDAAEEPRLLLVARHNLIQQLARAGQCGEALELLDQSRRLYLEAGSRMDLIRMRWLEGRIAFGLGRLDEAERSFTLTRDAFLEMEIAFDAALVSLEIALVAAQRGDTPRMKRIAAEVLPVFLAFEIEPDACAALIVLRDATEAEQAVSALEHLAATLCRADHAPARRR